MLRLLGAALFAAGSAALGLAGVARLEGRVRDLRGLLAGAEALERELGWRLAELPEGLELAAGEAGGRAGAFFRRCALGAARPEGLAFREVWRGALAEARLRLDPGDREVLEPLGAVLGRYDGESQRQALGHAAARLERRLARAAEDRRRLGRVYGALGLTAGLFGAILLL